MIFYESGNHRRKDSGVKKPIVIIVGAQSGDGRFLPYRLCSEVAEPVRKIRQAGVVSGILLAVLGERPFVAEGEDVQGERTEHPVRFIRHLVSLLERHDSKEGGVSQALTPHLVSETSEYLRNVFQHSPGEPPVEVLDLDVGVWRTDERVLEEILFCAEQYLPPAEFALVYSPNGAPRIPTVSELIYDIANPGAEHRVPLGRGVRRVA